MQGQAAPVLPAGSPPCTTSSPRHSRSWPARLSVVVNLELQGRFRTLARCFPLQHFLAFDDKRQEIHLGDGADHRSFWSASSSEVRAPSASFVVLFSTSVC